MKSELYTNNGRTNEQTKNQQKQKKNMSKTKKKNSTHCDSPRILLAQRFNDKKNQREKLRDPRTDYCSCFFYAVQRSSERRPVLEENPEPIHTCCPCYEVILVPALPLGQFSRSSLFLFLRILKLTQNKLTFYATNNDC